MLLFLRKITNRTLSIVQRKQYMFFLLVIHLFVVVQISSVFATEEPLCNVCQGDVTLSTQAEVNAFNCSEVNGNLTIEGEDITGFSNLNQLTKIEGNLRVVNTNTQYLDGLENLEYLGGDLYVRNNDQLVLFFSAAFEQGVKFKFETIEGSLTVFDNDQMLSLGGLGNIKTVKGFVDIIANRQMFNLQGFENIEEIQTIGNSHIGLQLIGNTSLGALLALEKLRKLGGDLNIVNNDNLNTLNELENLEVLEGGVQIVGNNRLGDCCALAQIISKVSDNADIRVNENGCNSVDEVLLNCVVLDIESIDLLDIRVGASFVVSTIQDGEIVDLSGIINQAT